MSIVQGAILCRAVPNPNATIRHLWHRCRSVSPPHRPAAAKRARLGADSSVRGMEEHCVKDYGVEDDGLGHAGLGELIKVESMLDISPIVDFFFT